MVLLSLVRATERAQCSEHSLLRAMQRGELKRHEDPKGRVFVEEAEFKAWHESWLARHRDALDPKVVWWTVQEIASTLGLGGQTVNRAIARGDLPAVSARTSQGQNKLFVAGEDLQSWIKKRSTEFPQVPMRGEILTSEQATQRYGIHKDVVRGAILRGLLPASRQSYRGTKRFLVGSLDVEDFLRRREAEDTVWTTQRISTFFGLNPEAVRRALGDGHLSYRTVTHPLHGPRREVDEDALADWLQLEAPPYRKEVAHLSSLVEVQEAARLGQVETAQVLQALPTLAGKIPRRHLDFWLVQRGLPASWEIADGVEWLRPPDAARLSNKSLAQIHFWIKKGLLVTRRRGRRWLIQRQSLLGLVDELALERYLTVTAAVERYKLPRGRLLRAMREGSVPFRNLGQPPRRYVLPDDLEAWLSRPLTSTPRRKPPGTLPLLSAEHYSATQAAALAGVSPHAAHRAIRKGILKAAGRPAVVTRSDLQNWLESLFQDRCGSLDPSKISLPEAAALVGYSPPILSHLVIRGHFTRHKNAAGKFVLDRGEFEAWRQQLPPHSSTLPVGVRYWTTQEIASLVNVSTNYLSRHIYQGDLRAIRVRGFQKETPRWVVSDSDLKKWLQPRWVSAEKACERYQCTYHLLASAEQRGLLRAIRLNDGGKFHLHFQVVELEKFLKSQPATQAGWSVQRIVEFTGLPAQAVRSAFGSISQVSPEELVRWMHEEAPPYRPEAAHLCGLVSSKAAGKLFKVGQTSVVKAIRAETLQAIAIEGATGPRFYISRRSLDLWLQAQGLPASWQEQAAMPLVIPHIPPSCRAEPNNLM